MPRSRTRRNRQRPAVAGREQAASSSAPHHPPRPVLAIAAPTWDRVATGVMAAWLAIVLSTTLLWHPTPLYSVESDLIGTYIPAARSLRQGEVRAEHFQSKGFGYPLLLAAAARLTGDEYFLAAKLLNVASGVVGATFTYLLFRGFLGAEAGVFILAGLLLNPTYARSTVEAATDMPSFALLIAATFFMLRGGSVRAALLSGLLAGYAVITRSNCAFLAAAGILVMATRPGRLRHLAAYAAGFALPLGAWAIAARGIGGSIFGAQNVANMAYEIYGRGLSSDVFGATIGAQFHSLRDVVLYDPGVFASRIGHNIATRVLEDARQLLPVWIGVLALPGLVLGWWRRPGWPGMALHVALCYLALAPVFYLSRFGLYLIPFYLSGVVALVLYQRIPWPRRTTPWPRWSGSLRPALLTILLAASAFPAVAEIRRALDTAPYETREGGLLLRAIGGPGARVMARKPHVAYFAGMDYVPLPDVKVITFPALIDSARDRRARYLFFSAAEEATRPQFGLLAGPGVDLPGMRQIAFRVVGPRRYFAIYEFTGERFAADTIESAVLAALRRFAERRPGTAALHAQIAGQLVTRGRYREALPEIETAVRLDPGNLRTADLLAFAYYKLGDYDAAAAACERALGLGSTSGWERAQLGAIRLEQGRPGDAVGEFREASRIEPGNPNYAFLLGRALFETGERAAAIRELEKVLAANPGHPQARYYAARAWQLDGNPRRALDVLEKSPHLGGPGATELERLADSIRAGLSGRR